MQKHLHNLKPLCHHFYIDNNNFNKDSRLISFMKVEDYPVHLCISVYYSTFSTVPGIN